MKIDDFKLTVYNQPWNNKKSVYITRYSGNITENFSNGEWKKVKEGFSFEDIKPAIELRESMWQELIDQLSREIKPTAKAEVDAELKATKYHLEDFRKLVFTKRK